jgi:23S rRNA (uracil1939-C5)-methyltransferase
MVAGSIAQSGSRRRADLLLVERKLFESRARARTAIEAGLVTADGAVVRRPSDLLADTARIEAGEPYPWVSRGGVKLAAALDAFGFDAAVPVCLDVGASTGGFTDVLLSRGAGRVYAVDVGQEQLHARIAADPRVVPLEKTDARKLDRDLVPEPVDLAVMDLSFISVRLVLDAIVPLLRPQAPLVILVKPQFEAAVSVSGGAASCATRASSWRSRRRWRPTSQPSASPSSGACHRRSRAATGTGKCCSGLAGMAEQVLIGRLGAAGDGIANTPAGPLYVPYTLPDEMAEVEGAGERGQMVRLASPSPHRIEPFCPYFGDCGGCVAQHAGPGIYASWKRGIVAEALAREGLETNLADLVDAEGEGRRRVTLHVRFAEGRPSVGFMARRSHRLVEIDHCPITVPALWPAPAIARDIGSVLAGLGRPLDVAVTATETGLDVDIRGSGPVEERVRLTLSERAAKHDLARLSLHGDIVAERRQPRLTIAQASLVPPPSAFLQATVAGQDALARQVVAWSGDARHVADLFAGVGPFALTLAGRAEVHAVDLTASTLAALDRAARGATGLRRITTETRDLFRRPLLPDELNRFEAVVLDPPRAGAEAQVRQLALSAVPAVIMASCDPGTFARDAATLVQAGFRLSEVVPVDQFTWAPAVELVGRFERALPRRRTGRRRQG